MHDFFGSYAGLRNFETEVALRKRINRFSSTRRQRNLKTHHFSGIPESRKTPPEKSRDYRDVIAFENQNVS